MSRIETKLYGRPSVRARLEAVAADRGATVAIVQRAVKAAGIKASRSAVARWLFRFRRSQTGTRSTLLAAVIRQILELDDRALKALARSLRRQSGKR